MKSAGLSLTRILSPVLALACVVCAAVHVFVDRVVPEANRQRSEIDNPGYRNERLPRAGGTQVRVTMIGRAGQVIWIGEYRPDEAVGSRVMVDLREGGRLTEKLTAERMTWEGDRWVFAQGQRRLFAENEETVVRFSRLERTGLDMVPEDLGRRVEDVEQMSNAELSEFIRRKEGFGSPVTREKVERHLRTAFPFASLVIVLFGLPLSTRIRRTGRPLQIGICLLASFVFYGCVQAGRALGWNDLMAPFWAAWSANILFGGVGVALLARSDT